MAGALDDIEVPRPVDWAKLVAAIRARRLKLVGIPVLAAVTAFAASFALPRSYTATASFVAETREGSRGLDALAGIAEQLSVNLPGSGGMPPQFFADVLTSREILDAVLSSQVRDSEGSVADSVVLLDLLVTPGDQADRLERGRRRLRDRVRVGSNSRTGIVSLEVTMRSPAAAADVADGMLRSLDRFNRETRQSQARERRRFAGERLAEADDSLRRAETQQRLFFERNRSFAGSPALRLEGDRLQRRVTRAQGLAAMLEREFELARLEEVNDTPLITVLDRPMAPLRPSGPRRWLIAGLAGFVAAIGVVVATLVRAVAPSSEPGASRA